MIYYDLTDVVPGALVFPKRSSIYPLDNDEEEFMNVGIVIAIIETTSGINVSWLINGVLHNTQLQ